MGLGWCYDQGDVLDRSHNMDNKFKGSGVTVVGQAKNLCSSSKKERCEVRPDVAKAGGGLEKYLRGKN